jgi:hypothetical protein
MASIGLLLLAALQVYYLVTSMMLMSSLSYLSAMPYATGLSHVMSGYSIQLYVTSFALIGVLVVAALRLRNQLHWPRILGAVGCVFSLGGFGWLIALPTLYFLAPQILLERVGLELRAILQQKSEQKGD